MDWLNYHHLLYFWTVARHGTIVRAARELHLSHPTISAQIRSLEESLGERLFVRSGRRLELTDVGRTVYRYADEIFATGREMLDTLRGRAVGGRLARLNVGVADALPKLVVRRLLEPLRRLAEPVRLVARDDKPGRLLADLAQHELDVVLTDAPVGPGTGVKAFNHQLGECPVAFYAGATLAARLRRNFPRSLNGAPVLLPTENSTLRRSIDTWLERHDLRPVIVAEFEDSALLTSFGEDGRGAFPFPTVVKAALRRQVGAVSCGTIPGVVERFYAITVERRIRHPAVAAICTGARRELFG
jgi:LysR family transcriptional activator of nhaA